MNPQPENPSTENPSQTNATDALVAFIKEVCENLHASLKNQVFIVDSLTKHFGTCLELDQLKFSYLRWILFYCWLNTLGLIWIAITIQLHPLPVQRVPEIDLRPAVPAPAERSYETHRELNARSVA